MLLFSKNDTTVAVKAAWKEWSARTASAFVMPLVTRRLRSIAAKASIWKLSMPDTSGRASVPYVPWGYGAPVYGAPVYGAPVYGAPVLYGDPVLASTWWL